MHISRQAHEICHRQKHNQLTAQGYDGGINAVAQGLETGAQGDAHRRHREAPADGPQRGPADGQEVLRGIEHTQKQVRRQLEHQQARSHQKQRYGAGQLQRSLDPLRLTGAVVIGDDGDRGIVDAEERHKEEALELEVNAEYTGAGLSEALKNLVHAEIHHGADTVHHDGGNTYRENRTDGGSSGLQVLKAKLNILVMLQVEDNYQQSTCPLADHRSYRRTGDAHGGNAKPAVDEDGVQNDIHHSAQALGNHGVEGAAGGLEQPLAHNLHKDAQAENAADGSIDDASLHSLLHIGLHLKIRTGAEDAEQQEQGRGDQHQGDTVAGSITHRLLVLLSQALAQQRVHAYADAHGEANLQVLHRECQGQRRDGTLGNLGYIDAVHHIVKRLHQHGNDNGQRHVQQQLANGHNAHLIFFHFVHTHLRKYIIRKKILPFLTSMC